RDERIRRQELEMLGTSALLYNPELEYKFVNLKNKVARFAMDKIRESLGFGIATQKKSKENCDCEIRVNYGIPCFHILLRYEVIPLSIVSDRWIIESNEQNENAVVLEQKVVVEKQVEVLEVIDSDIEEDIDVTLVDINNISIRLQNQQQLVDLANKLLDLKDYLIDPKNSIIKILPPAFNTNTKGRRKGTKRLESLREIVQKEQEAKIAKEKKKEQNEEKKHKQVEKIEEKKKKNCYR
ncbi:hypothetical protein INT48_008310, partial [Thamnidium elegans]